MKKLATYYAVVTQGLILLILLAVGGYFLGRFIDNDSYTLAGIFSVLGIIVALTIFIKMVLTVGGDKQ